MTWKKRIALFVIVTVSLVTMTGCQQSPDQGNQVLAHFVSFCKEHHIDYKVISGLFDSQEWNVLRVTLLWGSICFIAFLFIRLFWQWLSVLFSKRRRQSYRYRHLGLQLAAYITLISGCILYYVGFFVAGTASSVVAYFVRPFIASLGMFIGNTSYQEVCVECTSSPVYMTLFGIVHLAAITISAVVVINFFWKRLSSLFIRLWWWIQAIILKKKKTVNIFWGANDPSLILAKEIKEKGEHVVFVDTPSHETDKNQQMSLSQIFGMYPYDNELMRQLKGWHCIVMNTAYDIAKEEQDNEFILDKIGIGHLRGIIKNSHLVRIFFLSDYVQENIKSIINIQEDYIFQNPKCQIDIFGHAPRNNHNIALERVYKDKMDYAHKPAVHIIDSSYLSIQWLKTMPKYHPVQFVTQTPDEQWRGVVNKDFNALIVGFGETGQEALAFLYEFGAFVNNDQVRSPFSCYIIDPKANLLKDEFYMKRPALKDKKEISFMNVSEKSDDYWRQIEAKMPELQYIVVSTGTDEGNMNIAVNLYQLAIRCKKNNLSRFKIFVRSYSQRNESWMERISSYYNTNNQDSLGEIVVFGKMSEIYKYDNIVIDKVLKEAEAYGDKYYEAFKKYEEIVGKEEIKLSGLAGIRKKHRTLSQDIANSLHASTKFLLMGLNEEKLKKLFTESDLTVDEQKKKDWLLMIKDFSEKNAFQFEKDFNKIRQDGIKLLMYNMAMCEHLRWSAAHEMMGCTYGEEKDEVVKLHDCLIDFSDLPKFPQNPLYDKGDYDFLVLETSIKLKMKEYSETNNTNA